MVLPLGSQAGSSSSPGLLVSWRGTAGASASGATTGVGVASGTVVSGVEKSAGFLGSGSATGVGVASATVVSGVEGSAGFLCSSSTTGMGVASDTVVSGVDGFAGAAVSEGVSEPVGARTSVGWSTGAAVGCCSCGIEESGSA